MKDGDSRLRRRVRCKSKRCAGYIWDSPHAQMRASTLERSAATRQEQASLDIGPLFNQQLGDLLLAIPAGIMEWRPTILSRDRAGARANAARPCDQPICDRAGGDIKKHRESSEI